MYAIRLFVRAMDSVYDFIDKYFQIHIALPNSVFCMVDIKILDRMISYLKQAYKG